MEKLATPKNQFLQAPKTMDLLKRLKADYPQAIAAEQRIDELKFTKIYLILAIISFIFMVISFTFSHPHTRLLVISAWPSLMAG